MICWNVYTSWGICFASSFNWKLHNIPKKNTCIISLNLHEKSLCEEQAFSNIPKYTYHNNYVNVWLFLLISVFKCTHAIVTQSNVILKGTYHFLINLKYRMFFVLMFFSVANTWKAFPHASLSKYYYIISFPKKLKVETTTLYMLKFARVTLDNIFPALGNKMFNDNLAHRPMRTSISNMI